VHNIMEMKSDCGCDRQRMRYQQSIEFLHSQHRELIGSLHEEIERLKRKNRGLVYLLTTDNVMQSVVSVSVCER